MLQEYRSLEKLDFSGKGESFVEAEFITPLLKFLGYDSHRDYEVRRHGDDEMTFKLQYPPVASGSKKGRRYYPDYMPTIRKKCFWVLEAKAAKSTAYPFEKAFIVQGLQYCIHPEIRAKYLVLTNGLHTCIYDSFSRIYGDGDIYEPLLEFSHTEIGSKWSEIYQCLSAEKVREFIEDDILAMYEKVVSSSLDNEYPQRMLRKIEKISEEAVGKIDEHVSRLRLEFLEQYIQNQQKEVSELSMEDLNFRMDLPLIGGKGIGQHFVERSIALGCNEAGIFDKLIGSFEIQSYFRKKNTIAALCALYNSASDSTVRDNIIKFLQSINAKELPLLNRVECACTRIRRKLIVVEKHPDLQEEIKRQLSDMPETTRYINPPTTISETYPDEIFSHIVAYEAAAVKTDNELNELLENLIKLENAIDARYDVSQSEREVGESLDIIGLYYKDAFSNIMINILGNNYKLIDEAFDSTGLLLD